MPDNRKPLIYGAFPVCRNYTVRAYLRHCLPGAQHGYEGPFHDHRPCVQQHHAEHLRSCHGRDAKDCRSQKRPGDRQSYSPIVNGKRIARNVYAPTEEEYEQKLAALIQEMRARDRHREGTGNGGMKCTGLRRLFRRSPNFFWLLLPEARQIRASK